MKMGRHITLKPGVLAAVYAAAHPDKHAPALGPNSPLLEKPRKTNARQLEHREQVAVMRWADAMAARWPELQYLFHAPNGGQRSKIQGAMMKAAGVKRGVPDLLLPVRRFPNYVGCAIELKPPHVAGETKRVASEDQTRWLLWLAEQGWLVHVAFGHVEAIEHLRTYLGIPKHGTR